jgi:hypothetical protein
MSALTSNKKGKFMAADEVEKLKPPPCDRMGGKMRWGSNIS